MFALRALALSADFIVCRSIFVLRLLTQFNLYGNLLR
jgi:hypothetical protein